MPARDVIVAGASTGGLQALTELVRALPGDLPAALFVVIHTSREDPSVLAGLLARAGALPAEPARDGAAIRPGRIYVAPGNQHLLLEPGRMRVVRGPKENGFRPAVDPLFRTAAAAFGPRVIGIVLSGGLDDGTLGAACIKRAGGITVAQEPADAMVDSMPLSAIRHVGVHHVVAAAQMGALLSRLVREPAPKGEEPVAAPPAEHDPATMRPSALQTGALAGAPSPYTCPDCGGTLWESQMGTFMSFRCHTGHGFTAESLIAGQAGTLDEALWSALRALEEHAALQRRMAERARSGGLQALAERYEAKQKASEERAALVRQVLLRQGEAEERLGQPS